MADNEVFRIRALFKYPSGQEDVRERMEYDESRVPRIVSGFKGFRRVADVEVERLTYSSEYRADLSYNVPEVEH
ncbi:hypothetical protein [Streptomyces sp. NPDC002346]